MRWPSLTLNQKLAAVALVLPGTQAAIARQLRERAAGPLTDGPFFSLPAPPRAPMAGSRD